MWKYKRGNILRDVSEALVNPVNCVGIMGAGLALQFKHTFPVNFQAYVNACEDKKLKLGQMFIFKTNLDNPKFIINFPTKYHWRDSSRVQDIEDGLESLSKVILKNSIKSIAIPALGCGLGGLSWLKVRSVIEKGLAGLETIDITFYES